MADGGRREKKGKSRDGGALGLLIGRRATGRGEWRLGKVDLVQGDSTAGWRSEQAALRMAERRGGSGGRQGRVLAWGGAKGQAGWRWRVPLGPLGRRRAVDEVHWRRTAGGGRNIAAERREMEVRAYL
jgi:hypothetical protein